MLSKIKAWLGSLIPGIITVAIIFGPSKITITSKLGAQFGYSLLWIIPVAIFFLVIYTGISSRIGLASNHSLLTTIRNLWGGWAAKIIGIGIFLVTASFQAGNAVGSGIAIAELSHTSMVFWVVLTSVCGILLLFAKQFYKVLSNLMILAVILMLLAFLLTSIIARPSLKGIAGGFIPSIPAGSEGLVIAFMASCFSIVGAFYQSYVVQQRRRAMGEKEQADMKDRSLTGMIMLGIMSAAVMICASAVLFQAGTPIISAADMGKALEPLFGDGATKLFLFGLFGASFSSLVGNATLGGTLLADAFGWGQNLNDKKVKFCIAAIMIVGAFVAIAYGGAPLQLIVLAQALTIFVVPVIGFAMYRVSCNKSIMGNRVSNTWQKIFGFIGLLLVLFLAISNAIKLFFN